MGAGRLSNVPVDLVSRSDDGRSAAADLESDAVEPPACARLDSIRLKVGCGRPAVVTPTDQVHWDIAQPSGAHQERATKTLTPCRKGTQLWTAEPVERMPNN